MTTWFVRFRNFPSCVWLWSEVKLLLRITPPPSSPVPTRTTPWPATTTLATPKRNPGEKLSDAVARADLAFRAAAAHSCQPGAAGCFWAVYGLLTLSERSTYTGRPGVRVRLQRPLRESEDAADGRYSALLSDLLSWAKAQSTTSTPRLHPAKASGPSAAAPAGRPSTPRRHRRGSTATAAAAVSEEVGSSIPPSSSEDELTAPAIPVAAAAAAVSPRAPRQHPVFHYTGDRERDAVETERRRAAGLCLKCLPRSRIHSCPCPLHPSNPRDSSAPRCFPCFA